MNSATVDANGISAPTYSEILTNLNERYKEIFGLDAYIDPDSMDGQLLAIFALAQHDCNNTTINVFNSFSPHYAQGVGLSNVVKINGITRLVPTRSTCSVVLTGQVGTEIINGQVRDVIGLNWDLPPLVTLPLSGEITVTATCQTLGAVQVEIGEINTIVNPTLGWQTVNNLVASVTGSPVEADSTLRKRQAISTAYPALSVNQAIEAAVANVIGVTKMKYYENDTNVTDSDGIPAHSIAVVAYGGDSLAIATAIANRKTAGTGTYGTTTKIVPIGNSVSSINYFEPTIQTLSVVINLTPLQGYTAQKAIDLKNRLVASVLNYAIAQDVYTTKLIQVAVSVDDTYNLVGLTTALNGGSQTVLDKIIDFKSLALLDFASITVNIV